MDEQEPLSAPAPDWDGPASVIDRQALDQLFSVTYEELRRLASSVRRSDWNASLSPTTLVNEAWMKLAGSPAFRSTSPLHFKRIAARAMRQVLVEAARRRHAAKRGGEDGRFVTFDESIDQLASPAAGGDGREPLFRRPRRRRGGGAARRVRSDHPARLARGESVARVADYPDARRLKCEA
jgi:DNA-directed RNA polymerase specialized sigma24 family protein